MAKFRCPIAVQVVTVGYGYSRIEIIGVWEISFNKARSNIPPNIGDLLLSKYYRRADVRRS